MAVYRLFVLAILKPEIHMNPAPESGQEFDKSANTGFRHLINATRFSYQGLVAALKHESAFRQEIAVTILLMPVGIWLASSALEFVLLMAVLILVMIIELINSAIEAVVDRIGPERHTLSGLAKDYGSAAVMLSLVMAAMIWLAVLLEHLSVI